MPVKNRHHGGSRRVFYFLACRQGGFAKSEDELASLVIELCASASLTITGPPPAPVVVAKPPSRVPAFVTLGGAVALGAGALALGLSANADATGLRTAWNGGAPSDFTAYTTQYERTAAGARGKALASDILSASAVVATGVGLFLLFRNPEATTTVSFMATPSGAAVTWAGRL